jgi:hypothetical protein
MVPFRLTQSFAAASLGLLLLVGPSSSARTAAELPARLSDTEFWKLVSDVSEPGGYFRITDNYTSNEARSDDCRRCCETRA